MPQKPRSYRPSNYKSHDQRRGSAASRGYDAAWQRFRKAFLMDHPLCEDCKEQDVIRASRDVHHVEKVRDNPERKLDPSNCRALCKSCHDRRTRRGE